MAAKKTNKRPSLTESYGLHGLPGQIDWLGLAALRLLGICDCMWLWTLRMLWMLRKVCGNLKVCPNSLGENFTFNHRGTVKAWEKWKQRNIIYYPWFCITWSWLLLMCMIPTDESIRCISEMFHCNYLNSRQRNSTLSSLIKIFPCLCFLLRRGFISLEDKSYVLEPSPVHSDGTHWIYTADHLSIAPGTCGHNFNISYPSEHADSSPFRTFSSRVRIFKLYRVSV